jgi:predicted nucleic acid-binding protein
VLYWDSSAVLSALFRDRYSERAGSWAAKPGVHFLSMLAWAEVHAVIARVERDRTLTGALGRAARAVLDQGPWRRLNASPDWNLVRTVSSKWSLRGADLWHLCTAKALQAEFPELRILTFDTRLADAARREGLA